MFFVALFSGMLNTKRANDYLGAFAGLVEKVMTIAIPGEEKTIPAIQLARDAIAVGLDARPYDNLEKALRAAGEITRGNMPARIVIAGSLYLAGNVLALHRGEMPSQISGAARR